MRKIVLIVFLTVMGAFSAAFAENPPKGDTIRMQMVGSTAQFSFNGTDSATYYVDWGDGEIEKFYKMKHVEQMHLKHVYERKDTFNLRFWSDTYGDNDAVGYTEEFKLDDGTKFAMTMVYVEGAKFTMGATPEQGEDVYDNERPAHSVKVSNYYIGKYEVTQAQYRAVMGENPSFFKDTVNPQNTDDYPVEYVTWNQAQEFCKKLSEKTGKKYALPTEAQWEYAARGGHKARPTKYSGSDDINLVAWYWSAEEKTYPVGQKSPNELGCFDMSGNVWEWCADWYDQNYYSYSPVDSPVDNPTGPATGKNKVGRGGSWYGGAYSCRVTLRTSCYPVTRDYGLGFRVVRLIE